MRHSRAGGNPEPAWTPASAGATFEKDPSSTGLHYKYTYVSTGTETENADLPIVVDLEDEAGNAATGLEAGKARFDFGKPSIVTESTNKALLTKGTYLEYTFTVNKELGADPVVELIDGNSTRVTMEPGGRSGETYTYTYKVKETDAEGDRTIKTSLKDVAGNEAADLGALSVKFDFVAPKVSNTGVTPAWKMKGDVDFTLAFDVDKALEGDPEIVITNTKDPNVAVTKSATCSKSYCFDGKTPTAGQANFYSVTIKLTDKAGNFTSENIGALEIDNVAPGLAGVQGSPEKAKLGDILVVTITANETLKQAPAVKASKDSTEITFTCDKATEQRNNYTCISSAVTSGLAAGAWTLMPLILEDISGNVSQPLAPSPAVKFEVYSVKPDIANVQTNLKKYSKKTNFNSLVLTFGCPADVGTGLSVKLDDEDVTTTCAAWDSVNKKYTCTYNVETTSQAEGTKVISISAQDASGNKGANSASVSFDFTGPTLTLSITPDTRPAKLNENLTITVSTNETLDTAGVTLGSGALDMGAAVKTGNTYTWTRNTASSDQGTYNVTADAKDEVGNPATQKTGTAKVDGVVPAVSATTLNKTRFSKQTGFNSVSLTFGCPKNVGTGLTVTLGGQNMTCGTWSGTAPNYTCTYNVATTTLLEGSQTIAISTFDTAGNTGSGSTSVLFDFTAPTLTLSVIPSGRPARLAEDLKITVSSNEKMDTSGVVLTSGTLNMGTPVISGNTYTWTRTTTSTDSGSYAVTANGKDEVGNPATQQNGTAGVDGVVPTVSGVNTNRATYSKVTNYSGTNYAAMTLTFNCVKDVKPTGTLSVKVDTVEIGSSCTYSSPTYTCSYNVATYGSGDGVKNIAITATDAAGNVGTGSRVVTFDFTEPYAVTSGGSPNPAGAGAALIYSLNASEELLSTPVLHPSPALSPAFSLLTGSGTAYTWSRTVITGDTYGPCAMTVDLVDKVGNQNTSNKTAVGFTIDNVAPVISGYSVISSNMYLNTMAKDGDTITATFVMDTKQKTGVNPTVKFGGVAMNYFSRTGTDPGPYTYTYKLPVVTAMGNGNKDTVASVMDEAGNVAEKTIGSIELNFHNPDITGAIALNLTKPAGCPLAATDVSKVTFGTTYAVGFAVTEALHGSKPSYAGVKLVDGSGIVLKEIVLPAPVQNGLYYTYTATMPSSGTYPDGEYKLYVTMDDLAGNPKSITGQSIGFTMKTGAPSSPDVVTADKILFHRMPWGVKTTGGTAKFTVTASGNVLSADTVQVLVYDGPDPANASEIGRITPSGQTFSEKELSRNDRTAVYLAAYDGACNRSAAVKVLDADWTASMGKKIPGSLVENPNTLINAGKFQEMLVQDQHVTEPEVFSGNAYLTVSQYGKGNWEARTPQPSAQLPTMRHSHSLAFDSARGKVVMFGGRITEFSVSNDTWEWDGVNWVQKFPVTVPPARQAHALVYDSGRGRTVMFGGTGNGTTFNDTWEWDGTNWTQKQPATSPGKRIYHAMAYDSARGKTVLFAGKDGSTILSDTWEWDGEGWTQKSPSTVPTARSEHALAYDIGNAKTVMFGGLGSASMLADTYEWDGTNWTLRSPATNPALRRAHGLAYDFARAKTVMYGGASTSGQIMETWEWDGTNWSQKSPSPYPSRRSYLSLAYNGKTGKTLLFGGWLPGSGSSFTNETWEWDGTNWTQRLSASPGTRQYHAIAYDSSRKVTVLFGGYNSSTGRLGDTWEWDGVNWSQKSPATSPSARMNHAMAYDSTRSKVVLFGGRTTTYVNDTWEWDGTTWSQKSPGTTPPARDYHALAFDSVRGMLVLFGGRTAVNTYINDTYEWNGATWSVKSPGTIPPVRGGHALAYDAKRQMTVLFGGKSTDDLADTYEWNGTNWSLKSPSASPPARCEHALVYDAARGRVVLFGGDGSTYLSDTWEWNGTYWVQKDSPSSPAVRSAHAMAYDSTRKRTVMFGGYVPEIYMNDTWEWDGQGDGKAGQVAGIDVMSAEVFQGAQPAVVKTVTASFSSGGDGYGGGTTTYGASLMAWYGDDWHEVKTNGSGASAPGTVEWATSDAALIGKLLNGGGWKLNFAVVPASVNGFGDPACTNPATNHCDMGKVATEYFEVKVKYRLP